MAENKEILKVSLFEGRHELPPNEGAIYSRADFGPELRVEKTHLYFEVIKYLSKGEDVELIVTGLTPALTLLLEDLFSKSRGLNGELRLLHFNTATKEYFVAGRFNFKEEGK